MLPGPCPDPARPRSGAHVGCTIPDGLDDAESRGARGRCGRDRTGSGGSSRPDGPSARCWEQAAASRARSRRDLARFEALQERRDAENLEGQEVLCLHLPGRIGQLGEADGHGQRRVLDGVEILADHRQPGEAQGQRQRDLAEDLEIDQVEGQSGLPLGRPYAVEASPAFPGDVGGGVERQPEEAGQGLVGRPVQGGRPQGQAVWAIQSGGEPGRHQRDGAEVPEEQLHQQRRVSGEVDKGGTPRLHEPAPRLLRAAEGKAERRSGHAHRSRQDQGDPETLQQPDQVARREQIAEGTHRRRLAVVADPEQARQRLRRVRAEPAVVERRSLRAGLQLPERLVHHRAEAGLTLRDAGADVVVGNREGRNLVILFVGSRGQQIDEFRSVLRVRLNVAVAQGREGEGRIVERHHGRVRKVPAQDGLVGCALIGCRSALCRHRLSTNCEMEDSLAKI